MTPEGYEYADARTTHQVDADHAAVLRRMFELGPFIRGGEVEAAIERAIEKLCEAPASNECRDPRHSELLEREARPQGRSVDYTGLGQYG